MPKVRLVCAMKLRTTNKHAACGEKFAERLFFFAQPNANFPSTFANNFQVMKACSGFSQAGQETTLVVSRRPETARRLAGIDSSLWEMYAVPASFDIDWCPFPYPFYRFQQSSYALVASLYARMRHVRLAYTRSEWLAPSLSMLGVPTFLELHEFVPSVALHCALREVRSGRVPGVVCISQALAAAVLECGLDPDAVCVAHDAIDLERFEPALDKITARNRLGLSSARPLVCHVGHLYEGRGIETIIECAQWMPEVTFVCVGGNPADITRYQGICDMKSVPNVRFLGAVANSLVPQYLYAADVLVMPYTKGTRTHRYMSPIKMFEYLAAGRPIVASDFPVLREILVHETNAVLIEPARAPAMVDAIRRVLSDVSLAVHLSGQARRTAEEHTWGSRQAKILEFMKRRLSSPRFSRSGAFSAFKCEGI